MLKIIFLNIIFVSVSLAQFINYQVNNRTSTSPEEVTIAINPNNPMILAAGANINYSYRSSTRGKFWTEQSLTSTYGVWGDPATLFDAHGNLYFVHLSNPMEGYWIDRIVVQKSTDNGATFNDGSYTGVTSPRNQDKAWIAVDMTDSPYKNNLYLTWTEFDDYGSSSSSDSSRILFSKSEDFAESWSEPIQINDVSGNCIDEDETTEGAVPVVGPNGEIYVAWAGPVGIVFDKSLDGGETWGNDIFVANQVGGWDHSVSGISRANGLPVTACDTSYSDYRGNIYVMWVDQRNGFTNHDVFIARSEDGGETWSEPVKVNDDETQRPQFFAWMAIDQTNGNIYISFYDRRNTTNNMTEYYLARSSDGGQTFTNYKVTDSPFPTFSSIFFGDYTNIAAYNGYIHPIWMETDSQGRLSVWTVSIQDSDLIVSIDEDETKPQTFELSQNYPNPFSAKGNNSNTIIEYKLGRNDFVKLSIYNSIGQQIVTLVNSNQFAGTYSVEFSSDKYNLPSGVYYYQLITGDFVQTKKMVILN